MAKAVLLEGNSYYVSSEEEQKYRDYYNQIKDHLRRVGYDDVVSDPAIDYTQPPDADLWVGHSRGAGMLWKAPEGTRTLDITKYEDGYDEYNALMAREMKRLGYKSVRDFPVEDRPRPGPEHYTLTDRAIKAIEDHGVKTSSTYAEMDSEEAKRLRKAVAKKIEYQKQFDAPEAPSRIYHGSQNKIDKFEARPHYLAEDEPVVFGTPSRAQAISFLAPWRDSDFEQGTYNDDPTLHITEQYPGAFEKIYKGRKGHLYELDPSNFEWGPQLMRSEFISKEVPEVLNSEELDVYEAMLAEEAAGRLKIHRAKEKTASEQDQYVYHAVPRGNRDSIAQRGILSGAAILEDPEMLKDLAKKRNWTEEQTAAKIRKNLEDEYWHKKETSPSVFFTEPDWSQVPEWHTLRQDPYDLYKVNLSKYMREVPGAKIHGVELKPWVEGTPYEERELTLEEAAEFASRGPKGLWKDYSPVEGYYAVDVPHAFLGSDANKIPAEYAELVGELTPGPLPEKQVAATTLKEAILKTARPKGFLTSGDQTPPEFVDENYSHLVPAKPKRKRKELEEAVLRVKEEIANASPEDMEYSKMVASGLPMEEIVARELVDPYTDRSNWKLTPEEYKQFRNSVIKGKKKLYPVARPFALAERYGIDLGLPKDVAQEEFRSVDAFRNFSYPSFHTARGTFLAETARDLVPEADQQKVDDLIARIGRSRIQQGVHSHQDVEAGEALGREAARIYKEKGIKTASEQDFTPDFTPAQLKELGVYDQVYGDAPSEASMKEWPEHWINKQDPLGWLQWYDRYSQGRRTDDDSRQIKRWKSFKARHLAQYLKNPTPRRAAALRNWGIDVSNQEKLAELVKESKGRLTKNIHSFIDGLVRQGTPIKDINVAKHLKLSPQGTVAEQQILREAELIARRRLMQTHNVASEEVRHLAGTGGGTTRMRNLRDFQGARNEAEHSLERKLNDIFGFTFQDPARGVNQLAIRREQEIQAAVDRMTRAKKGLKRVLADPRNEGLTLREVKNLYYAPGRGRIYAPREGEGVIRGGKLVRPGQTVPEPVVPAPVAPAPVAPAPVVPAPVAPAPVAPAPVAPAPVVPAPVAPAPVAPAPVVPAPVVPAPVAESSNKLRNALIGTSILSVPAAAYAFSYEEPTILEKALSTIENMSKTSSLLESIQKTAADGTATKRDPKKWSAAKSRAKAKMGGKWSARAAQLAVKYYKDSGGSYSGKKPTKENNKLKKWTKEEWGYRPGSKAEADSKKSPSSGTKGRYLPKKKWQRLSKSEQKATDSKKLKGMQKGKDIVSNTAKAKYDSTKDYTKKSTLLESIQTLQYPEKVAPQFQGYISQKRTTLTTPISELPQPPHPANDSRETRNELLTIKKHMEEGKLPESLMTLADRTPEKIFEIACKRFGVEPKSKQASIIKKDFNKIAFDLKYIFKRPRPWSLAEHHGVNLNVTIPESADTPSYPSGHAMMGYGLAEFYKSHYPEYSQQWDKIADIIQHSRLQAGLHFPSDNKYAKQIVEEVSSREKLAEESPYTGTAALAAALALGYGGYKAYQGIEPEPVVTPWLTGAALAAGGAYLGRGKLKGLARSIASRGAKGKKVVAPAEPKVIATAPKAEPIVSPPKVVETAPKPKITTERPAVKEPAATSSSNTSKAAPKKKPREISESDYAQLIGDKVKQLPGETDAAYAQRQYKAIQDAFKRQGRDITIEEAGNKYWGIVGPQSPVKPKVTATPPVSASTERALPELRTKDLPGSGIWGGERVFVVAQADGAPLIKVNRNNLPEGMTREQFHEAVKNGGYEYLRSVGGKPTTSALRRGLITEADMAVKQAELLRARGRANAPEIAKKYMSEPKIGSLQGAIMQKQAMRNWNLVSKVRGGAARLRDAVTRRKAPATPNPAQAETQVVKSTQPAAAETQVVQQTNPQVVQQTTQQTTQAASPTYAEQWKSYYESMRANPLATAWYSPTTRGAIMGAGVGLGTADENRLEATLAGAVLGAGAGRQASRLIGAVSKATGKEGLSGRQRLQNLFAPKQQAQEASKSWFSRFNPVDKAKENVGGRLDRFKGWMHEGLGETGHITEFGRKWGTPIVGGALGAGAGWVGGRFIGEGGGGTSPVSQTTNNIISIDQEALKKMLGLDKLSSAIEKRGSADYRPRGTLMLTDGKGNVLAGSASSRPGQEATSPYYFPGGGVFEEEGVDRRPTAQELEEGIRREALEELGYSIKNYRQLKEDPTQLDMPEWWRERQWRKRGVGYKGLAEYFAAGEVDKKDHSLYNIEGDAFDGGWHSIEDVATALEGVSEDSPYYENNLEEARLLRSLQQKTAKVDHVELRRKERANHISKNRISKLREAIKETQQSLPKGTHHVKLDNASAVIKDVGHKHVLATLLAANMNPPGGDLSSALLKARGK